MDELKRSPKAGVRRRRREGLSILEVIISLSILAAGLLAMLTMQVHALRGGRHGRFVTEAATVAQEQLEFLDRSDFATLAPSAWSVPRVVAGANSGVSAVPQTYNVQFRIVADPDPNLLRLDVQVQWAEPSDPPNSPPHLYAMSTVRHNDP